MGWNDTNKKGSEQNQDRVFLQAGTAKLIHILLGDNEEPYSYWTHFIPNNTPNGPKGKVVICPGRETCPACSDTNKFRTKRMHSINVWDYEHKVVKMLEAGNAVFQPLKQIKDQTGSLLNFDISIKKTGAGKDTDYSVIPIPMMTPFDTTKIHNLFNVVNMHRPDSPAEIKKVILDMGWGLPEQTQQAQGMGQQNNWPTITITPQTTPERNDIQTNAAQVKNPNGTPAFTFGKYKGRTVSDVYNEDPNYIKWCAENITDPNIKAEAKKFTNKLATPVIQGTKSTQGAEEETTKQILINTINKLFQTDDRYKTNFALVIDKMKESSVSDVHPNGKTIINEYTTDELKKLYESIK